MRKNRRFMAGLGAALVAVFALFRLWQSPGLVLGRMTQTEIDRAMAYIDKNIYLPPDEKPLVSYLTEELVRQGHDVTLFASGDLRTSAKLDCCPAQDNSPPPGEAGSNQFQDL